MKIKMKLFLLCAAVAPFLMMTSSQQNGSRFGCVCAFEKGNSNEPNENAPASDTESFDDVVPDVFWDSFNQNVKILKQYSSANNTLDYYFFERIVKFLAEDKGDSIKSFKNKLEKKAVDWLDFCFLSAFLEGLLAARNQNFESMEHNIKTKCPKDFPFDDLKKLTCSMWTQLESIEFRFNLYGFYHGLISLMKCRESEFFVFISCLAKVRSPYMQLFIACLMNFAYSWNTGVTVVDWYDLINIMNKFNDRLDSVDGVESILSCFYFGSKVKLTLRNYYSSFLMKKDAYYVLSKLAYLSSLNVTDVVNVPNSSRDRKK